MRKREKLKEEKNTREWILFFFSIFFVRTFCSIEEEKIVWKHMRGEERSKRKKFV